MLHSVVEQHSWSLQAGAVDQERSWVHIMRGSTQFYISVEHKDIQSSQFGSQYLALLETCTDQKTGSKHYQRPLDLICEYCRPLTERLAAETSWRGCTVENLVKAPTHNLYIVRANGHECSILGGDELSYSRALNLCPRKILDVPRKCQILPRLHARDVRADMEDVEILGSLHGRVRIPGGVERYIKPREDGREREVDRELDISTEIKRRQVSNDVIKIPDLDALVVTGDTPEEESIVGFLFHIVPSAKPLLDPWCWQQHAAHDRWKSQVTRTVKTLHEHGLVWGDVNPGNVLIDEASNAWVIDFGGMNNPEFVDNDKAETIGGDWQGIERLFGEWLRRRGEGVLL